MDRPKKVLLLLSRTMTEYHRGTCAYAREAGWHLTSNLVLDYRYDLDSWDGDGVIVSLGSDPELYQFIKKLKCPIVDLVCTRAKDLVAHRFQPNEEKLAELAFDHFRENGYVHFAFWGRQGFEAEKRRREAFQKKVETEKFPFHDLGQDILVDDLKPNTDLLTQRLLKLPLPCAVACINDVSAVELIEAALASGLRVPEDLAVLGANNNQLAREASPVPLSSIDLSLAVRARESAMKLDELMNGQSSPPQEQEYEVLGLIADKSSDETVFEHQGFSLAVQYIKKHFTEQITPEGIAQEAGLSRRGLERHFHLQLGRSITEEIHRRRIRQAKALLLTTKNAVNKVAKLCGYNYSQSFHKNFARLEGMSPAKFRERYL